MASDNSPPRVRAIAGTAFIAFAILIGLKFVFDSYYLQMFEAEEYIKNGSVQSKSLIDLHAAEKRNLTTSSIPIDRAMGMLARSREAASAGLPDGGIIPEQSTDTNSLLGWQKMPLKLTAVEAAEGAPDGGAASASGGDGGAAAMGAGMGAGDAGATPALAIDGGKAATGSGALLDASAAPTNKGTPGTASDAGATSHP